MIPLEIILSLMKYYGLSYPTHILKFGGSGIGDNFLEYGSKQVNNIWVTNCSSYMFHYK